MSNFVVYVRFEPFVAQWLTHSYGSPVVFPAQSVENSVLRRFTQKQPGAVPAAPPPDALAIVLPDSRAKDPAVYNHLGRHGQKAVVEIVEDNFRRALWNELHDLLRQRLKLMTAIYSWCELHGISIDYADTIRQRFYRIRDAYVKKGVEMRITQRGTE